jgi:hypothetical protein
MASPFEGGPQQKYKEVSDYLFSQVQLFSLLLEAERDPVEQAEEKAHHAQFSRALLTLQNGQVEYAKQALDYAIENKLTKDIDQLRRLRQSLED